MGNDLAGNVFSADTSQRWRFSNGAFTRTTVDGLDYFAFDELGYVYAAPPNPQDSQWVFSVPGSLPQIQTFHKIKTDRNGVSYLQKPDNSYVSDAQGYPRGFRAELNTTAVFEDMIRIWFSINPIMAA